MTLPRGWELILVVVVIVLLFGAKRLPDAARGVGRSLRIFKAETKGLADDGKAELPAATGQEATAPSAIADAPPAVPPTPAPTDATPTERTES